MKLLFLFWFDWRLINHLVVALLPPTEPEINVLTTTCCTTSSVLYTSAPPLIKI